MKESQGALAYDRSCLESDQQEHTKKANYLKDFRDGNKKVSNENMLSIFIMAFENTALRLAAPRKVQL